MSRSPEPKRWVVKLGTGILTDSDGQLDLPQIEALVDQVARLRELGQEVILVTSGAVGGGMGILQLKQRPKTMPELQGCAAIGQPRLMSIYEGLFSKRGYHIAQILLTYFDLDSRSLYRNARNTLDYLVSLDKFIPIINENDVVSYEEIRFGDNDQLSAHVAVMVKAGRLIILSNIPGLTSKSDGTGDLIPEVPVIDEKIEALAGTTQSQTSVGGMVSKLKAARVVTAAGIPMQIAHGREPDVLVKICQGATLGTMFLA